MLSIVQQITSILSACGFRLLLERCLASCVKGSEGGLHACSPGTLITWQQSRVAGLQPLQAMIALCLLRYLWNWMGDVHRVKSQDALFSLMPSAACLAG